MLDPGNRYDGLSLSDMQMYGAEDMEELAMILEALDRANGVQTRVEANAPGPAWAPLLRAPRRSMGALADAEVPSRPGVCAVFDMDEPVFLGKGTGQAGLRGRIRAHLATDADLSRSTLRASVAVDVLGVSRWTARQRPASLPDWAVASVNERLSEFHIAWVECSNADEASDLKRRMLTEFRPEYNMR
ncbi:hypothetical protein [Agromyces sp. NPDC058064]|uniref:hypothetical protein n=1 Tax=Agromyces sp. NPDC058064 TaxID=3346322 RepID=UPI0036DE5489